MSIKMLGEIMLNLSPTNKSQPDQFEKKNQQAVDNINHLEMLKKDYGPKPVHTTLLSQPKTLEIRVDLLKINEELEAKKIFLPTNEALDITPERKKSEFYQMTDPPNAPKRKASWSQDLPSVKRRSIDFLDESNKQWTQLGSASSFSNSVNRSKISYSARNAMTKQAKNLEQKISMVSFDTLSPQIDASKAFSGMPLSAKQSNKKFDRPPTTCPSSSGIANCPLLLSKHLTPLSKINFELRFKEKSEELNKNSENIQKYFIVSPTLSKKP